VAAGSTSYQRAYLLAVLAFEQLWDAGCELHYFEPARCLALRIGENLTVLAGQKHCNFVKASLKDFPKSEEHSSPPQGRLGGPRWECCGSRRNC
jgi:hypothetical protein